MTREIWVGLIGTILSAVGAILSCIAIIRLLIFSCCEVKAYIRASTNVEQPSCRLFKSHILIGFFFFNCSSIILARLFCASLSTKGISSEALVLMCRYFCNTKPIGLRLIAIFSSVRNCSSDVD